MPRADSPAKIAMLAFTLGIGAHWAITGFTVSLTASIAAWGAFILLDHLEYARNESAGEAAASYENILQACDLFFAGADDLTSAWGLDEDALLPFLANLDCETILLKRGADNLLLIEGGEVREVETEPVAAIVDTTGAGDAFNAGYLAALLRQHNTNSAARFANTLGAACLAHPGALLPEDTWHSLREALIED